MPVTGFWEMDSFLLPLEDGIQIRISLWLHWLPSEGGINLMGQLSGTSFPVGDKPEDYQEVPVDRQGLSLLLSTLQLIDIFLT